MSLCHNRLSKQLDSKIYFASYLKTGLAFLLLHGSACAEQLLATLVHQDVGTVSPEQYITRLTRPPISHI